MSKCEILDTFPAFLKIWHEAQNKPVEVQIDMWHDLYMVHWPEMLQKQLKDYADQKEDWRKTAGKHIFPHLSERLPAMQTARDNLLEIYPEVYQRLQNFIRFEQDLTCVLYVGIGCGAGWADTYQGKPAILFGLENIAEEGWQEKDTLKGLMAHELGHLIHFDLRQKENLAHEDNSWWQLYTEGFAQWCEHKVLGTASWHMQAISNPYWLTWCDQNAGWLAGEFLRRIDHNADLRPFFGSWYDLQGYKQTGYYLGFMLIKSLYSWMSLREIATIINIEDNLRPLLEKMADH